MMVVMPVNTTKLKFHSVRPELVEGYSCFDRLSTNGLVENMRHCIEKFIEGILF